MLHSELDKKLTIFGRVRVDDNIGDLIKLRVAELPDLLEARAVAVHDSFPLGEGAARIVRLTKLLQEFVVEIGRGHFHVGLGRIFVVLVEVEMLLYVAKELWEELTTKHVPVTLDADALLTIGHLVDFEARVGVAPTVAVVEVDPGLPIGVVIQDLGVALAIDRDLLRRAQGLRWGELLVNSCDSVHQSFFCLNLFKMNG